MAVSEDSRPFVELRESAEDFLSSFDSDIKALLNLLESKLSSLIRDPDSTNSPSKDSSRLEASLEFSKAKYNIFVSMKSMAVRMEESWKEHLSNMITNFLERVEISLASTQLEVRSSQTVTPKNRRNSAPASPSKSSINKYSIINQAKRIPVIGSFLSKEEEDDMDDDDESYNARSKTHFSTRRSVTMHNFSTDLEENATNRNIRKVNTSQTIEDDSESSISDEDVEVQASKPVYVSPPKQSSVPSKSDKATRKTRGAAKNIVPEKPVRLIPQRKTPSQGGRKSILKVDPSNNIELHATPSRSTRKRTAVKETNLTSTSEEADIEFHEINNEVPATSKTPKNVHFSVGLDINDDLEIYSPDIKLTRATPRRKTALLPESLELSEDFNLTPNVGRSKRKTIASEMDLPVAPSPKKLKRGSKANVVPTITEDSEESDHSENGESSASDGYTPWLPLNDVDTKVPNQPGIYELKVYKAKKSAYIGSCDNLRHKLTLHKIGQNSGHKHLDKFLERNKKDIQVRYEKIATAQQAKNEEMNRIKAFVAQFRTTPAYN